MAPARDILTPAPLQSSLMELLPDLIDGARLERVDAVDHCATPQGLFMTYVAPTCVNPDQAGRRKVRSGLNTKDI